MNELIENKKKSEILSEYISTNKKWGDSILHKDIEKIISEKHGTTKYNSEISRTKRILLKEYGIILESIRGDGYRLTQPDGFVGQTLRHYKKGFNEIQTGMKILEHAPVKEMTEDGKDIYKRVFDRSVILTASMQGARAELKTLSRRQHPLSPELVGRK